MPHNKNYVTFFIKLRNNIHLENAQDYLIIQKHEKFHDAPYI